MLRKDHNLLVALQALLQVASPLQESLEDTAAAVGHEAYRAALLTPPAVIMATGGFRFVNQVALRLRKAWLPPAIVHRAESPPCDSPG